MATGHVTQTRTLYAWKPDCTDCAVSDRNVAEKKIETIVRRLCTVAKEIKRSELRLWRTFMFSIVFIILSEN